MAQRRSPEGNLEGFGNSDAIIRLFKALPQRFAERGLMNGLRAGARIVRDAAKQKLRDNNSVISGNLLNSLTVSTVPKRARTAARLVQIKHKRPYSRYAHIVEFHAEGSGKPYLAPAAIEAAPRAYAVAEKKMLMALLKEADKLSAQFGAKR